MPTSRSLESIQLSLSSGTVCNCMYLIGWLASQSGLRGVLLGDFSPDCQIAKLKTLPNFPAIQYAIHILVHYYLCPTPAQPPDPDLLCPA